MKQLLKQIATKENNRQAKPITLGRLLVTPGIIEKVSQIELLDALVRHRTHDWGNVGPEDWAANDRAALQGGRILSTFDTDCGTRFWIITEADRRVTTALLPTEY
jgi:hypothetical protein